MAIDQLAPGTSVKLPLRTKQNTDAVVWRTDGSEFDLVETYHRLLKEDHELSMPVAAIEALIELLSHVTATTLTETFEIIEAHIIHFKTAVPNPIPPTNGAELFTNTLFKSLRQERHDGSGGATRRLGSSSETSFDEMRQYLVNNSRGFAAQAKAARVAVADVGARYVSAGSTVLTSGGSRCVKQMLLRAADRHTKLYGSPDFRVICVMDGSPDSEPAVQALREADVPVSTIDVASTAHAMKLGKVDRVFVGAEVVCQRGGVLSRMGTYQLALLTKELKKDFYVVTETHKFTRATPLDQTDVTRCGIRQNVLDFKKGTGEETVNATFENNQCLADYTPPELVKAFITEQGTKTPGSILEFVLSIYRV